LDCLVRKEYIKAVYESMNKGAGGGFEFWSIRKQKIMCLLISFVFAYLSYVFYIDGNYLNSSINGLIAIFFSTLLIRNIIKTKKEKSRKKL
jgi:hypothetical protein